MKLTKLTTKAIKEYVQERERSVASVPATNPPLSKPALSKPERFKQWLFAKRDLVYDMTVNPPIERPSTDWEQAVDREMAKNYLRAKLIKFLRSRFDKACATQVGYELIPECDLDSLRKVERPQGTKPKIPNRALIDKDPSKRVTKP